MTKQSFIKEVARICSIALAVCSASLLTPQLSWSQANSATFYGTVLDPSGAAIPSAAVTLTAEGTQATMKKTTGSSGDFVFTFVPAGTYTLTIAAKGFSSYTNTGISLVAGQQIKQTYQLALGSVAQTVTVEGGAPLINTVSAQQLHSYSITDARQLPLENRNFAGLLKVNAGVVPTQGNNGTGVDMNGVGRNGTVYSVDGTNATGNSGGNNPGVYQGANLVDVMSVEGIAEVSAVKGVIPAQYADALGGQINVVSKSGTNAWHGSLFENHQDSALNARFQFTATKPQLTLNQFGGSVGGPIKKNKIFVFGDYEGYRVSKGTFVEGNVPTATVRDELTTAVPAYNLALQAFPLPNQPTAPGATVGDFATTKPLIQRDNHVDAKGDVVLTDNSRLSISYNRGTPYQGTPRYYNDDSQLYVNSLNRGNISYTIGGGQWTSETRFGYDRTIQDRVDQFFSDNINPNQSTETILYGERIPDLQTDLGWSGPVGEINHSGGPLWQIEESYARNVGRHSLKFGGDYHESIGTRNNPQIPDFLYSGLDNLLRNMPSQVTATLGSGLYRGRMYEYGFFAQDDWQVTPKLSINMGLRYDVYSNFVATGQGGTPAAGLYNPSFLSMDGAYTVGPNRSPADPYENDANNFGPRFGFAYNPDGRGKTAIRGGIGVMHSNIPPENFWNVVSSGPNIPYRVTFSPGDVGRLGLAYPEFNDDLFAFSQQLASTSSFTNVAAIVNPHLQSPYAIQYTLSVERELPGRVVFESAGVGTRGVKYPLWRIANQINRLTGDVPNPELGQPYYLDNSQSSTYYGWQNTLKKRFSHGFSVDLNYTWSKALANGGGDIGSYYQGENDSGRNQEFFDSRADRGPTPSDITHYFSGDFLYQSPSLRSVGNRFVAEVLGNWQISGIISASTGLPVTITQSSSTSGQRGEYIGGDSILPGYQNTLEYLNRAAFALIPVSPVSGAPIAPGNAGPGEWRQPGIWNVDASFAKEFSIREAVKLQIRADMFNAFNHTNLSGLRTSVNDPLFGRLTNTRGARVIQVNARFTF